MSKPHPPIYEQQLELLERECPAASGVAFSRAYQQAVQAGLSLVVSENGEIGNQVRHDSLPYFQFSFAASLRRPFHLDPLDLHLERPSLFVTQHEAQGVDLFWLH